MKFVPFSKHPPGHFQILSCIESELEALLAHLCALCTNPKTLFSKKYFKKSKLRQIKAWSERVDSEWWAV